MVDNRRWTTYGLQYITYKRCEISDVRHALDSWKHILDNKWWTTDERQQMLDNRCYTSGGQQVGYIRYGTADGEQQIEDIR